MEMREIDKKYLDVLQNIEAVIVAAYRDDHRLSDYSVMSVLEALINIYTAEITRREPRPIKLSPQEQTLFDSVKEICEWRLGRVSLENAPDLEDDKKTIEEMLIVLKRLLKSAKFWNREQGSQGYLNYIIRFL